MKPALLMMGPFPFQAHPDMEWHVNEHGIAYMGTKKGKEGVRIHEVPGTKVFPALSRPFWSKGKKAGVSIRVISGRQVVLVPLASSPHQTVYDGGLNVIPSTEAFYYVFCESFTLGRIGGND